MIPKLFCVFFGLIVSLTVCKDSAVAGEEILRIGHFPNLTHAQALILHNGSRNGGGLLEQKLGPNTKVEWFTYNAGPSAMEAIIAGSIDLTYVGPNPAMNAFIRSDGTALKVISGSAKGGAGLVLRAGISIADPKEFHGKTIATPQLGNTQDISARAYFKGLGFHITQLGGDVRILPVSNADHLIMMAKGDIHGAWTVEPWLTRLENETGATLYKEDKDVLTTVVAASPAVLKDKAELINKFLQAHNEITSGLTKDFSKFYEVINAELAAETTKGIPQPLFAKAMPRIRFSSTLTNADFEATFTDAMNAGFIKGGSSIEGILR